MYYTSNTLKETSIKKMLEKIQFYEDVWVTHPGNNPYYSLSGIVAEACIYDNIFLEAEDGWDLRVFDNIYADIHSSGIIEKRKRAVLSSPYIIECMPRKGYVGDPVECNKAKEISEFIDYWLKNNRYTELFSWLLTGLFDGISVVEHKWDDYGLMKWRGLEKERINFLFCPMSKELKLAFKTQSEEYEGIIQPTSKYTMLRVNDGNGIYPYGRGINSSLYWSVYFKNIVKRYWVEYSGRSGINQLHAHVSGENKKGELVRLLNKSKNAPAIVTRGSKDSVSITSLGQQPSPTSVHSAIIEHFDNGITFRALGELLSSGGVKGGSYSLGSIHEGIRNEVATYDSIILSECLQHMFYQMVCRFFGRQYIMNLECPSIKFVSKDTTEQTKDSMMVVDSNDKESVTEGGFK